MLQQAIAIQLPFWQAPQDPLAMVSFNNTCQVFFALWDLDGHPIPNCLGKITFFQCWATKTLAADILPYFQNPHGFHSYLLEVNESEWLAKQSQNRLEDHPTWRSWDKSVYHHYVMEGTESYLEVLGAGFTATMATAEESQHYAFLLD